MHDHPGKPRLRELVVRRLEAFSDIVIGFSLAQLGLSLVIPERAIDFVQRPLGLVAFFLTSFVVVRFSWTHFKIFRHFFEPNRLMIVCNFIALASMTVAVLRLQPYLHFVALNEGMVAARIYFGLFALAYGSLGLMLALGLRFRYRLLSVGERRAGLRDVVAIFGAIFGYMLGNALSTNDATNIHGAVAGHREIVATAPTTIFIYTFIGWLTGLVAGRTIPKLVRILRPIPDPRNAAASD